MNLAIVIAFATYITGGASTFTKAPKNLTVPIGSSIAPFFCQYLSAVDIIWRVNGSSLHQLSDPSIIACSTTLPNGQRLDKLKMPANLEYNGTSVVCVAVFFDRDANVSDPARLIILDNAPSLPTGFVDIPDSLIVAIGERAVFNCQHCSTLEIDWQLNGTIIPSSNLPDSIDIDYTFSDDSFNLTCGGVYSLIFADIVTYNETIIQCEANIYNAPNEVSDSALLLTQGQLGQVTNLRRNFSSNRKSVVYEWDPPFSLNVTNADPDIAYCVHIYYNVTCPTQERITLLEKCAVTKPTVSLTENFGTEEIYEIEITAKTNLDVALNGTNSATYRDKFVAFNHTLVEYNITVIYVEVLVQLYLLGIDPSSVLPNEIEVQLIDAYSSSEINEPPSTITCPTALMSATMSYAHFNLNCPAPLEIRRLYLSTIFIPIAGCRINSSSEIELSTHLIQNVQVFSLTHDHDQTSGILVSGDLLNADVANTTALGFLTIAYSYSDPTSLYYGIATPLVPDMLYAEVVLHIKSSSQHQYRVSVFSIEQNGLPFNKSAYLAQSAIAESNMTRNDNMRSSNSTPNVLALYRDGCVKCSFLDASASSCVIITLNKSQKNSSTGITSIEVFDLARKGDEAYECINRSINDFDIIVFTFDKTLARISDPGVAAVELTVDQTTTAAISITTTTTTTNEVSQTNAASSSVLIPALTWTLVLISVAVSVILITVFATIKFLKKKRNRRKIQESDKTMTKFHSTASIATCVTVITDLEECESDLV